MVRVIQEKVHIRDTYTGHKGIIVVLLNGARLYLHGHYLSYMTDYNPVLCWSFVNENDSVNRHAQWLSSA